jgi:hypothetical protein
MALSALGVLLWIFAHGDPQRALVFDYFAAWIAVATSAAGVYDFTRGTSDRATGDSSARERGPSSAGESS